MDRPSGNTGISPAWAEDPRKGCNSTRDRSAEGDMLTEHDPLSLGCAFCLYISQISRAA